MCVLAGVDPTDDSVLPPLPADPSNPDKDLYNGGQSWPSIDGEDMMPKLLAERAARDSQAIDAGASADESASAGAGASDRQLWLSTEVLVEGRFKLLVAQPNPKLTAMGNQYFNFGWHKRNNKTSCEKLNPGCWEWPTDDVCKFGHGATCCAFNATDRVNLKPCLFDVDADMVSMSDIRVVHFADPSCICTRCVPCLSPLTTSHTHPIRRSAMTFQLRTPM